MYLESLIRSSRRHRKVRLVYFLRAREQGIPCQCSELATESPVIVSHFVSRFVTFIIQCPERVIGYRI